MEQEGNLSRLIIIIIIIVVVVVVVFVVVVVVVIKIPLNIHGSTSCLMIWIAKKGTHPTLQKFIKLRRQI